MPSAAMLQRSRMLVRSGSAALAASAAPGASAATLPRLRSASRQAAGCGAAALHTSASSCIRASSRHSAPPDVEPSAAPSQSDILTSPRPFYQPFKTRLPMPLPRDVHEAEARRLRAAVRSEPTATLSAEDLRELELDRKYFLPSRSRENLSVLHACLTTGLVDRASKLFAQLQSEEDARTMDAQHDRLASGHELVLDEHVYNLMLGAFLRKAWATKSSAENAWLQRAWTIFFEMVENTPESRVLRPRPGPSTLATMLKGCVRLRSSGSYPASSPSLYAIVSAARRFDIPLDRIFSSHILSDSAPDDASTLSRHREQEPDAAQAIAMLIDAAFEAGDVSAQTELQTAAQNIASGASPELEPPSPTASHEPLADLNPTTRSTGAAKVVPNLEILRDSLSAVADGRQTETDPYIRQEILESSALKAARLRLEQEVKQMEGTSARNDSGLKGRQLRLWMWDWLQKLEKRITHEVRRMSAEKSKAASQQSAFGSPNGSEMPDAESPFTHTQPAQFETLLLPFLGLLSPKSMALITIVEVMRLHGTSGVPDGTKATRALIHVGRAIENEHQVNLLRNKPHLRKFARKLSTNLRGERILDRGLRQQLRAEGKAGGINDLDRELQPWTQSIRARVGSFLIQMLMQEATVTRSAYDVDGKRHVEEHPAFYAAYQYINGRKLGIIRVNEVVSDRLDKENIGSVDVRMLPMLVSPRPWMSHNQGGYQTTRSTAMRYKESVEQEQYLKGASDNGELDVVLSALDVLGQTPWRINRRVYDVISEVWNKGDAFADIPASPFAEPEPERPADYDSNIQSKADYTRRLKVWSLDKANAHSQRCDLNYKLEIARAFMGERIYFPHNMDFRGRAYPIPPHLNHLGDDLCRGLLLFDKAKPLGERGLYWLQIHLANLHGFDKANFNDRKLFTEQHEKQIRASASNPLGESEDERWWLKADDPWQCLATCIELQQAYDCPEGPEAYESRLPVHQDGTCNGLQHYAALGGDMEGAQQVNLVGGDRPSDVYTKVADLVIEIIERQAKMDGHPQQWLAQAVRGKITRKVVKQTVMTTVYGVTFIGAKNQIYRQLQDRGDLDLEVEFQAATYLAHCVLMCIGDLFSGAGAIQLWLTQCARLIARSIPPRRISEAQREDIPLNSTRPKTAAQSGEEGKQAAPAKGQTRVTKEQMTAVIWTTPLGLPVVQPYRKAAKSQVLTAMQSVFISDPNRSAEVDANKQASAFPPNFIHSLDATHMFLTAIECHAKQLTFASVHDSYWTHACDIDTMSDVIRDTFVRLHSENILGRLRAEFLDRYEGFKVPAPEARAVMRKLALRAIRAKELRELAAKPVEEMVRTDMSAEVGKLMDEDLDPRRLGYAPAPALKTVKKVGRPSNAERAARKAKSAAHADGEELDEELEEGTSDADRKPAPEVEGPLVTDMSVDDDASRAVRAYDMVPRSGFVDLADLLPQPPMRGAFDVSEIKRSLYFFS